MSSNPAVATIDDGIVTGVALGEAEIAAKAGNVSARCSVKVILSATALSLPGNYSFNKYQPAALTAALTPSDSNEDIEWTSSDESIVTVSNGDLTGVSAGKATITAKTSKCTASCEVSVLPPVGSVDLGIVVTKDGKSQKIYWATCNLGASGFVSSDDQAGERYAWGETETKSDFSWENYKWANGAYDKLTKYIFSDTFGSVDSLAVLQLGENPGETIDDAARAILGGKWHMPSNTEWLALLNNCSRQWTTNYNNTGVAGMIATSKVPGYEDVSIFFPTRDGTSGLYWSSSLNTSYSSWAVFLSVSEGYFWTYNYGQRYSGYLIRPVIE